MWMQCPCIGCSAPGIVPYCGCRGRAVNTVSYKAGAVCFVGRFSAHEGGCIEPAVLAVPPTVSLNVDAVPMQCMQCRTRWMQYVVTEDAVPTTVNAVRLQ